MGTTSLPGGQLVSTGNPLLTCIDWKGVVVADGHMFVKDEACTECTCSRGDSVMCKMVHCLPPVCVHYEQVKDACCDFICTKLPVEPGRRPDFNVTIQHSPGDSAGDLGLRLIASTVTSVLVLTLLLFMIYRLRQRRLLIMMRQRQEEDAVAYMTTLDQVDIGIEFPVYDDPPPPYYPPKPPDIPPYKPPPPYEEFEHPPAAAESVAADHTNGIRSLLSEIPPNSPDLIPQTSIAPDLQPPTTSDERRSRSRVFRIKDSYLTQGEEELPCGSCQGACASAEASSQDASLCSEEDCVSVYRNSAQPLYKHYGFIDGPKQRCSYNSLQRPKRSKDAKRWHSTEIENRPRDPDSSEGSETDLPGHDLYRLPSNNSPHCAMPVT